MITDRGIDHDVLSAQDIAHVLEELVHAASSESFAELSRTARMDAETRALEELTQAAGREVPALFTRLFRGDPCVGSGAAWYTAYSLFVTEELKTNERFRSIFFATELVDIRKALDDIPRRILAAFPDLDGFMADIRGRLGRIEAITGQTLERVELANSLLREIREEFEEFNDFIVDLSSKSVVPFNGHLHWMDMTGGIAAGYFQNFIRQLLAGNGPIADGLFSRLIIVKPHSLFDFTDPMHEFYTARSSRLIRQQTFEHPSLPRKKAVIDVFDGRYIVDYPTPLNSLRYTLSFDIRWRSIPYDQKDSKREYQNGLITAFFANIVDLLSKDENYKLKYLDIVTVEEFDKYYLAKD